ncbi:MAG: hypothetical protein JST90_18195 [Bacteroidetes bacterium]|nr:hypothetical protein [Bacteroidota bacterium]
MRPKPVAVHAIDAYYQTGTSQRKSQILGQDLIQDRRRMPEQKIYTMDYALETNQHDHQKQSSGLLLFPFIGGWCTQKF